MKTLRSAFTLVEILISVMILSGAIVYVLKLHSQSREQIIYVSQHNKHTLEDSLFLSKNIFRYHKSKKSAYDLLPKSLKPRHFQSRDILKKLERNIYIPEPINLLSKEEEETQNLSAAAEEIKLKGNYSSYFFRFNMHF
ncbi:MAG: prepilin-type N-terminal cleavage/methylation domain-containing protein [Sulfurovum sp.]|nr:prepilin-type N-terminal cleavage/methylation domain-containing protein [Sulfurovum sp.]MCB4744740.1 prepilin-type N-terminal cleavage/methylation domain-containing protein [Sulfurovum sp.]MCB4746791.1 prepilin-type N-terminal cleavage/methylation domain-containing protein [Sulfurovum sp.]MCB4747462.1 prepilin-type N-terminal cleavage/methylation domain-containing protein [Sulfurovum sp.]MCB4749512.1 prepilin-type N-terminal cleavage/methylation domain-containing protein [Sulfurovum sp.]